MDTPLPVVVLPGLDGTLALRAPFVAQLSRFHRVQVIAYPDDPTLDYRALDTFVQDRLPFERFAVLGESFSGPIAMAVARSRAGQCAALILVSTFARNPWPAWFTPAAKLLDARLCPEGLLEAVMLGARATPAAVAALHQVTAALPRRVLQSRVQAALTVDARAVLAASRCRVLCLHGRSDWLIPSRCALEITRVRPDAAMVWLDGSHNLLMTHAEDTTWEIRQFLASV